MKKVPALISVLVLPFILSSCIRHWKDGGTVTYDLLVCKIISWDTLAGKQYTEIHFFPKSLLSLDAFADREEKEFEALLESAKPKGQDEPYVELRSLDTYPSSGNKKYDAFVKRGKEVNYYLIRRMLNNKPTKFYIPDIAAPLTDGDIAFMMLTDINCDDGWETKLFPSFVTGKEGYTSRYLFDYLHASESNRLEVAQKLLEHYVEDKNGYLGAGFEMKAALRYLDLLSTIENAKPLIENEADREKLSDAINLIFQLSKLEKSAPDVNWHYDTYTDGIAKLEVLEGSGGPHKGAGSHRVNYAFYLTTKDMYIHIFLTDDDCNLVVDIGGGGDRNGPLYNAQGGDDGLDFEPDRFYEINTKSKLVKVRDFYWY
ncbi:MAG: hypothetical protein IKI90_01750 [Treponema sp.]|nr:hypothetical protein [Treponema sp.]